MPEQAKPMWLARNHRGSKCYVLFGTKPTISILTGLWEGRPCEWGEYVRPTQSPVKLKPGGGPVKVRLVVEGADNVRD